MVDDRNADGSAVKCPLRSAFAAHPDGEPVFTNHTETFSGCLDYLFYSHETVAPVNLLSVPSDLDSFLPNAKYSSDVSRPLHSLS